MPDLAACDAAVPSAVDARPVPLRAQLRFVLRSACLIGLLGYGLLLTGIVYADVGQRLPRERMTGHWSRLLLRLLGVRWTVRGRPADAGLIVANHVSWLDISLISAACPTRFVSKSEVRDWPVAGWLANGAGTFYLRRGGGGSRQLAERLATHLRDGGSVTVFPEGTTTDGSEVLPFHPRLMASAIGSERAVQPVAVRYGPGDDGRHIAPFIGDDDLVTHVLRLLRNRRLPVELVFCAPLAPAGASREQLAGRARDAIRAHLVPSSVGKEALPAA